MNTKTPRIHKIFVANNRGMSLPVALVLGLVTTSVALVVIAKTQTDKGKTVAQVNAVKSSTIAETGVNQYLDFLNNNRILLTYPPCVNVDAQTGACTDSGSIKSWSNPTAIVSAISSSPTPPTCSKYPPNSSQPSSIANSAEWQKITGKNWQSVEGGQYKLVSYTYQPNSGVAANTAPGTGTLVIEGRTNVSGSGASNTQDQTRIAQTQISIKIPVDYVGLPALWTKDSYISGTAKVFGDGWDSSGCVEDTTTTPLTSGSMGGVPANPIVLATRSNDGFIPQYQLQPSVTGKNISKLQEFPDLPNNNNYTPPTGTNVNTIACPYTPSSNVTFPRGWDRTTDGRIYTGTPLPNATYVYKICGNSAGVSIDIQNQTVTLGSSAQDTLVFYLDGALNVASNGNVTTVADKTTFYIGPNGKVDIQANGNIGKNNNPTALQFYIYAQDEGTITQEKQPGGTKIPQSVILSGNGSLYSFVFAPFANVKVSGTGDIAGALWAQSYEGAGNGTVLQGIFDYSRLDASVKPSVPTLGQASSWERKPVN